MPPSPRTDRPSTPAGRRPSDRTPPPDDVTDRLLWTLAVDVAAAHQPGPDGSCSNLQCRGQHGPCRALHTAYRAAQLARHPAPAPPPAAPALTRPVARGRAAVIPAPDRFTNWFGADDGPRTPPPAAPAPLPAPAPAGVPHTYAPFRRPTVATAAA
jgi:hypothetical protein